MRVIAIEMGSYRGHRIRAGQEFEFEPRPGQEFPKWLRPATPENRAAINISAEQKRRKDVEALIATAGPKRAGVVGAREVNTGLATATPASPPGKVPAMPWETGEGLQPAVPATPPVMAPAGEPSLF